MSQILSDLDFDELSTKGISTGLDIKEWKQQVKIHFYYVSKMNRYTMKAKGSTSEQTVINKVSLPKWSHMNERLGSRSLMTIVIKDHQ